MVALSASAAGRPYGTHRAWSDTNEMVGASCDSDLAHEAGVGTGGCGVTWATEKLFGREFKERQCPFGRAGWLSGNKSVAAECQKDLIAGPLRRRHHGGAK